MHLIYIDDSGDAKCSIFTAWCIPANEWAAYFETLKAFRKSLKVSDGVFTHYELHAVKWVAGKGLPAGHGRIVPKSRRVPVFNEALRLIASMSSGRIYNAIGPSGSELEVFEYLTNRLQRSLVGMDSRGILICDEGKEAAITRLTRKMRVFNHIPSRYGQWGDGSTTKNIQTNRIVEDPVFKASDKSYFIQMVDFCAYALLHKEQPRPKSAALGLDKSFELLDSVLEKRASSKDPHGIVRFKNFGK